MLCFRAGVEGGSIHGGKLLLAHRRTRDRVRLLKTLRNITEMKASLLRQILLRADGLLKVVSVNGYILRIDCACSTQHLQRVSQVIVVAVVSIAFGEHVF